MPTARARSRAPTSVLCKYLLFDGIRYVKSGSSSNIDDKFMMDSAKDKKEKAKELLKKNSNKLVMEVSVHNERRRPSLEVDDVL